jgi:hypothetical protein
MIGIVGGLGKGRGSCLLVVEDKKSRQTAEECVISPARRMVLVGKDTRRQRAWAG